MISYDSFQQITFNILKAAEPYDSTYKYLPTIEFFVLKCRYKCL